jgi:hypothetical protein
VLRSCVKDSAVIAVTSGYGLNVTDSQIIAKRVEGWLDNDSYIFPPSNDVSAILLPVDFELITEMGWRRRWIIRTHSTTTLLSQSSVTSSFRSPLPPVTCTENLMSQLMKPVGNLNSLMPWLHLWPPRFVVSSAHVWFRSFSILLGLLCVIRMENRSTHKLVVQASYLRGYL